MNEKVHVLYQETLSHSDGNAKKEVYISFLELHKVVSEELSIESGDGQTDSIITI